MSERLCRTLQCELPIQLAPMGSVSASARLPLAVAATGAHAMYPGLALPPAALAPVLDPRAVSVTWYRLEHDVERSTAVCEFDVPIRYRQT